MGYYNMTLISNIYSILSGDSPGFSPFLNVGIFCGNYFFKHPKVLLRDATEQIYRLFDLLAQEHTDRIGPPRHIGRLNWYLRLPTAIILS